MRHRGHENDYSLFNDARTLAWLVRTATFEIHAPQWRSPDGGSPRHPHRRVLDLDAGDGGGSPECAAVALLGEDLLAQSRIRGRSWRELKTCCPCRRILAPKTCLTAFRARLPPAYRKHPRVESATGMHEACPVVAVWESVAFLWTDQHAGEKGLGESAVTPVRAWLDQAPHSWALVGAKCLPSAFTSVLVRL